MFLILSKKFNTKINNLIGTYAHKRFNVDGLEANQ